MSKRCGNCGSTKLKKKNQKTKIFSWKDYPSVILTEDFILTECDDCRELIVCANEMREFDDVLMLSISNQVKEFVEVILKRENCTQAEIASHLGITEEYLCEIKQGRKIPKFQTFNFLKTLAAHHQSFVHSAPLKRSA